MNTDKPPATGSAWLDRTVARVDEQYAEMPAWQKPTPPASQPTVTLGRETFDRLIAKGESIERAAVHGTFYHTVAIEMLTLLRAAEQRS